MSILLGGGELVFAISAPCFIVFVFFIVYAVLKRINIPLAKKNAKGDSILKDRKKRGD